MADIKTSYGASSAVTITLTSLASDSNLVAGRSGAVVDNSTSKYLDYLIAGKIKAGTSPTTGKVIEVWAWGISDDTPSYPDTVDGSDSNTTVTSRDILSSFGRLVAAMTTDATTGRTYYFGPVSVASLFGGIVPAKWGIFVVHNMGVALDSSGSNHVIKVTPTYVSAT